MSRSMRGLLADPPPADAKRLGGLTWVAYSDKQGNPLLNIWFGKSERPKRYSFKSAEHRGKWLAAQIVADQKAADEKKARKVRQQAAADQMAMTIQVGTILHNSWGYDQTNCDFYQVVRREGRTAWVREICGEKVPGSDGYDCCRMRACPDQFREKSPEIRKIIGRYGVQFEFGSTSITTPAETHYCSWYA